MSRSLNLRRLSRPIAPTCRGGASSLLRLAQPGRSIAGDDLGNWVRRTASAVAAACGERSNSIITRLAPSIEFAAR